MKVAPKNSLIDYSFRAGAHRYAPGARLTKPIRISLITLNLLIATSDEIDANAKTSTDIYSK